MDPLVTHSPDYNYDYDENFTVIHPTDPPEDLPPITVYQWAALFLYILVVVLGVPGNGLVVWITAFEMKRSVNTVWFLNLAVADLLCCLSAPFNMMLIILGYWPMGAFTCRLIAYILLINMYASVLLLTMISIDRCALVMKPVWCQRNRTLGKSYVACMVMWVLAAIFSSPAFIFRNINQKHGKEMCLQDYAVLDFSHRQRMENFIAIFRLLMGFIVPFLVIAICYSILVNRVKERFTQNTKTMKVVLVVILGFFICWLPYHVERMILAFNLVNSELYKSTVKVDHLFIAIAFMNSCINPIIYVLMGQDFKSKCKRSIRLIVRNALVEDKSQSVVFKKSKSTSESKNTVSYV